MQKDVDHHDPPALDSEEVARLKLAFFNGISTARVNLSDIDFWEEREIQVAWENWIHDLVGNCQHHGQWALCSRCGREI